MLQLRSQRFKDWGFARSKAHAFGAGGQWYHELPWRVLENSKVYEYNPRHHEQKGKILGQNRWGAGNIASALLFSSCNCHLAGERGSVELSLARSEETTRRSLSHHYEQPVKRNKTAERTTQTDFNQRRKNTTIIACS